MKLEELNLELKEFLLNKVAKLPTIWSSRENGALVDYYLGDDFVIMAHGREQFSYSILMMTDNYQIVNFVHNEGLLNIGLRVLDFLRLLSDRLDTKTGYEIDGENGYPETYTKLIKIKNVRLK